MKKFASRPRTPSTGVKEARRRAAAEERMAVTTCECDRATSNNATVWGCHTPLILQSVIREGTPSASFASCTIGSFKTSIVDRSLITSLTSLRC